MERIQAAQWIREDARRSVMAAKAGKTVAKPAGSGIMEEDERNGGKQDVQFVGKIDRELYRCVSEDITTDEVIITDERVQHIKDRHPGHYEKVRPFLQEAVAQPDYILVDKGPHTGLILKQVVQNGERIHVVLRLHTSVDAPGFKNSVISAWKISEARWENYLRNKATLYKRE